MPLVIRPRRLRAIVGVVLGTTGLALFGVAAEASAGCPQTETSKPFARFWDTNDYSLIPNGNLESDSAGWTLDDAFVAEGNEPFYVGSRSDSYSLRVGPGGTAVSPEFCVDKTHVSMRFFARQPAWDDGPDLKVWVRYVTQDGVLKDQQLETFAGDYYGLWRPTRKLDLWSKLGFSNSNATTTAQLMLEVEDEDTSPWRIDDVYVDPYRR